MNLDLPPTGTEQPPAFVTAVACQDWLATVPVVNAVQAQSMLLRQLNLLHRYTLPTDERFRILETLRATICDVQDDAAKKFGGKPLPLAPHEQAALGSSLNLWVEVTLGYLRCFEECCGSITASRADLERLRATCITDPKLAHRAAMMAQRTLATFADWQLDLNRGGQLPESIYWQKLNQIMGAVEIVGIARQAVQDPVHHGSVQTSPLAAYAECCLIATANVYELPARHIAWASRWARRWGAKLALLTAPPEDLRNRAVPLWVSLDAGEPPSYQPQQTGGGRWLETTELRKSIVARIALLEQGRAPAELQLGDDVTQPAATLLLQRLLQRWCKGGAERRHERTSSDQSCRVVIGMENVHFELSGHKAFRPPTRSDSALRRERQEMEGFGKINQRASEPDAAADHVESWRVVDESLSGLRIRRNLREGGRVGPGQVVAVRTADGQYFVVGNVRWVLREGNESVIAGVQLFLGAPQPMGVRQIEASGGRTAWQPGFALPAVPALKESASILVPAGTFRLDRQVEMVIGEETRTLKLFRVLDRGIDFERCNYYD